MSSAFQLLGLAIVPLLLVGGILAMGTVLSLISGPIGAIGALLIVVVGVAYAARIVTRFVRYGPGTRY